MKIAIEADEILKRVTEDLKKDNRADTYEEYKRKNGLDNYGSYASAVNSLYAASKRGLSSYGKTGARLADAGLSTGGYAAYVNELSKQSFNTGLAKIKDSYSQKEADASRGYVGYLEKYADKQKTLKKSVMSHLIQNDVVDLNTAIAYGISAGLSKEDAESVSRSAYEVTKQKVFNSILEQTVTLGLDKEGARQLAIKMGVSDTDARLFADEIGDMLEYYGNISKEYLEYLEQRSN